MAEQKQPDKLIPGERRKQRVKDPATGEVKEFEVVIRGVAKPKQ